MWKRFQIFLAVKAFLSQNLPGWHRGQTSFARMFSRGSAVKFAWMPVTRMSFLFSICLGLGWNRSAAQQSLPDLSDASLEQLGNIPVYSASMHLQPSGDAPSSVTSSRRPRFKSKASAHSPTS